MPLSSAFALPVPPHLSASTSSPFLSSPRPSPRPSHCPSHCPSHRPSRTPSMTVVRASVPITIEAPRTAVYALFSDLSVMPQWSTTLKSVTRDADDPNMTSWVFGWLGVQLGWRACDTAREENGLIAWRAVSGVVHDGRVDFADLDDGGGYGGGTRVRMTVEFDAGVLSGVLGSGGVVRGGLVRFVEGALEADLQKFRQFVLVQERKRRKQERGVL